MINLCCFLLYACHCSRNPPIQLYWAILYKRLELCTSWQEEWRIYIYKTILSYYSGMLRRAVEFATRENHDMWIYFKKKHNSSSRMIQLHIANLLKRSTTNRKMRKVIFCNLGRIIHIRHPLGDRTLFIYHYYEAKIRRIV